MAHKSTVADHVLLTVAGGLLVLAAIAVHLALTPAAAAAPADICRLLRGFNAEQKRQCEQAINSRSALPNLRESPPPPRSVPAGQQGYRAPTYIDAGRGRPKEIYVCPGTITADTNISPFDAACRDQMMGEFKTAIPKLSGLCERGIHAACYEIGMIYSGLKYSHWAEPNEMKQAPRYLARACELGNYYGCYRMAVAYDHGDNVRKDPAAALILYQKACGQGMAGACRLADGSGDRECPDGIRVTTYDKERGVNRQFCQYDLPGKEPYDLGPVRKVAVQGTAPTAPASLLSGIATGEITQEETSAVYQFSATYAKQCQSGAMRACAVFKAIIDSYDMASIIAEGDNAWTRANSALVAEAMKQVCLKETPTPSPTAYCDAYRAMAFALDFSGQPPNKFGSAAGCLTFEGQSHTVYTDFRDRDSGVVVKTDRENVADGVDLQNVCKFEVDYRLEGWSQPIKRLGPGKFAHVDPVSLFVVQINSIVLKWIWQH